MITTTIKNGQWLNFKQILKMRRKLLLIFCVVFIQTYFGNNRCCPFLLAWVVWSIFQLMMFLLINHVDARNFNDEKRKHYNAKTKFKVWYAAVTQSFFSLSVGFGTLTTYSSYNKVPAYIYMSQYTHIMAIIQGEFFNCPRPLPPPFPKQAKCQPHHIFKTNTKT